MPKRIKLDFSKFKHLADGKGYILGTAYVDGGGTRFLECRTPTQQKTFIIAIPDRYSMGSGNLEKIEIRPSDEMPSSRQIESIISNRGDTLSCDLISILPTGLCSCVSKQAAKLYNIVEADEDVDVETVSSEETADSAIGDGMNENDTVSKAIDILRKIDPTVKLPVQHSEPERTDDLLDEILPTDTIELTFEDDDGNEVDDVTEAFREGLAGLDGDGILDEDELADIEYGDMDNSIPGEFDDENISLGIVYLMVPIKEFFKSVGGKTLHSSNKYEDEIIKIYNLMHENELAKRESRLKSIDGMCNDLRVSSKARLELISKEEKSLRVQLMRLTVVLKQSNLQIKKVMLAKEKYGDDIVSEVVTIKSDILSSIHTLNLELIRLKELADEILGDFESSLRELSEL